MELQESFNHCSKLPFAFLSISLGFIHHLGFSSHLQNPSKFTTIFFFFFSNLLIFLVSLEELEMLTIQFLKTQFCAKSLMRANVGMQFGS